MWRLFALCVFAAAVGLCAVFGEAHEGCTDGQCLSDAELEEVTLMQTKADRRRTNETKGVHLTTVLSCPNMHKVSFIVESFDPVGSGLPAGAIKLNACTNIRVPQAARNKKGVVLFLHGAGLSADDYAEIYPHRVHRPDDYDIVFLNTPCTTARRWMRVLSKLPLDNHWDTEEVVDATTIVLEVVNQLAVRYGGHANVWLAGFSQGGVITSTAAFRGKHLLGGAFVIAGYPPRTLYTDADGAEPVPEDWSSEVLAERAKLKIYFYTGDGDHFLGLDESFWRYKRVVDEYGLAPENYRFWSKHGYCHWPGETGWNCPRTSPHGNEFHALWHLVQGEPERVRRVTVIEPDTTRTA